MLAKAKLARRSERLIAMPANFVRAALTRCVRFYQRYISILLPSSCRFYPSCSNYALEALQRKKIHVALWLIVWRIFRCQPLFKGGYDPIPNDAKKDKNC